jgi:hypothetical protein
MSTIASAAALACVAAPDALAYIDPGTGSMLLQVIGAGIAGAIFYFREFRIWLVSLFSRRPAVRPDDGPVPPADDAPR